MVWRGAFLDHADTGMVEKGGRPNSCIIDGARRSSSPDHTDTGMTTPLFSIPVSDGLERSSSA